jgi:hypothetical protein
LFRVQAEVIFRLDMRTSAEMPEALANLATFLTLYEREWLWRNAIIMADSRGILLRLTSLFGRRILALRSSLFQTGERLGGATWNQLVQRAQEAVEDTLWRSYNYATFGLEALPRIARPKRPRNNALHCLAATASGLASGFVGLPGVLFDIPFTTTTILRSIAEVARDSGEDLASEDTRRACLEVLAFGGPSAHDDEAELGYWATRLGVNHLTIHLLIQSAASRLGVVLSEKILAQTVPVAGAITGGALNYAFISYYQNMAQVHFCLRALERRTGQPEALRLCFEEMVRAARERRRIKPDAAAHVPAVYLPPASQ